MIGTTIVKRPSGKFVLPSFKIRKSTINARLVNHVTTASSDQRIMDNTESLRLLYEFLRKPLP